MKNIVAENLKVLHNIFGCKLYGLLENLDKEI